MKKPRPFHQKVEVREEKKQENPMGGLADVFSGLMKGFGDITSGGGAETKAKPVESEINGRFCMNVRGFKNMKVLDLKYNTKVTDKDLKGLAQMHALERLDLSGTKVSGNFLKYLKKHPNLKELYLIDCRYLTDGALKHLNYLKGLERIIIARADISGTCFRTWAELEHLKEIRLLACTKLLDRNLKSLSAVPNLETLIITALS